MKSIEVIVKKEKKPWYKNNLMVIPILLFFPYIGIPWMWKFADYSGPLKVILTGMELFAIIYFSAQYNTLWLVAILITSSVILSKFVDSDFKWKGGDNMKKKIILGVIGVIILFAVISAIGGSKSSNNQTAPQVTTQQADTQSSPQAQANTPTSSPGTPSQKPAASTSSKPEPTATSVSKQPDVPTEYKSALSQATSYANTMHMSKKGVYDQLVSEYGGKFSPAAAQYAIDNVKADWNANALAKAKTYQDTMHLSPASIHDQLTSEYGEKFTQAEADYAIQYLNN